MVATFVVIAVVVTVAFTAIVAVVVVVFVRGIALYTSKTDIKMVREQDKNQSNKKQSTN